MGSVNDKLLIIGKVWPEPDSSAAGSRMMQLIELFQSEGFSIICASAAGESEFMVDLASLGVESVPIKLNDASFDDFVKDLELSVVLFDRYMTEEQFGWRVAEHCPDALRILDTEDLHSLRFARQSAWKNGREMSPEDLHNEVSYREIASVWRSDLSLIISQVEMDLLKEHFKVDENLLLYLPFMLDSIEDEQAGRWPHFESRRNFISIGNFLHEPNWNAVLFLKEEIWPLIRERLPDAELYIYGAYSSTKVEQLHDQKTGFIIKGRAEDAKEVVQTARVLLAPLRFGAGLKGKLAEAMQCGTPSVTTSIGAEGMKEGLPWAGTIADSAEEIANSAVELYQDGRKWREAQQRGVSIINTLFQKENRGAELIAKINELRENPGCHRSRNFIGAMLQHHSLASTRFMSKWIEEKNKKC